MVKYFFWGIIAAAGALVLEMTTLAITNINPQNYAPELGLAAPLVLAAVIEEALKFSFVLKTHKEDPSTDKVNFFSKILLIGLGFSITELLLNIFKLSLPNFPYGYALGTILLHLATIFMIGYLLLKTPRGKTILTFLIAVPAIVLHLLYNLLIIYFF